MDMIEIIHNELKKCGKGRGKNKKPTRYQVAKETGISEAQLHRIVNGGSMKAETVGALLEYFGYEIRKKGGGKRK